MNYLGSGKLGEYFEVVASGDASHRQLVVGRRLKNMTLSDWAAVRRSHCVFLDTVDLMSISAAKFSDRLRWRFNLYRIEKTMMYFLVKALARGVYRIHIPAIVDSHAWLQLAQKGSDVSVSGLSYQVLAAVVLHVAKEGVESLSSSEVFLLCEDLDLVVKKISVRDCVSARLVAHANRS